MQVLPLLCLFTLLIYNSIAHASSNSQRQVECKLQLQGYNTGGTATITAAQHPMAGLAFAALECAVGSNDRRITVGVNTTLLGEFLSSFTGMEVVPLEQQQLSCKQDSSAHRSTAVNALIAFCGEYELQFSQFDVQGVILEGNDALADNALVLVGGDVRVAITDGHITNNKDATALLLVGNAAVSTVGTTFKQNMGHTAPAVRLHDSSSLTATACNFSHNTAAASAGAVMAHDSANISFVDCFMDSNVAVKEAGALLMSDRSTGSVFNSSLSHNRATAAESQGGAVVLNQWATIFLHQSRVSCNSAFYGGALYVWDNSRIVIDNSTVAFNHAKHGGAFYARGLALTYVQHGSIFYNNTAARGGAICLTSSSHFTTADSVITNNTADLAGGAAYLEGDGCVLTITNASEWSRNNASYEGGAVYAGSGARVFLSGEGTLVTMNFAEQGGAVFARDLSSVVIGPGSASITGNAASLQGGAICGMDFTNVNMLADTRIVSNSARSGGGLYVQDSVNVSVAGLLANNTAAQDGGGACVMDEAVFALQHTAFINSNAAGGSGGGVFLESGQFAPQDVEDSVVGNTAMHSRNFAVASTSFTAVGNASRMDIISGRDFVLALNVTGHFGLPSEGVVVQAVMLENSTDSTGSEANSTSGQGTASTNTPIGAVSTIEAFIGSNRSMSSGIVFLNLNIRRRPGQYRLLFSVVSSNNDLSVPPIDMPLFTRPCVLGEVSPSPDSCEVCGPTSYSRNPANTTCDACPPGAECPGGFATIPQYGFWHSAAASNQIHRCPNPRACEGDRTALALCATSHDCAVSPAYVDKQCSSEFTGNLCGVCAAGFGTSKPFDCGKCIAPWLMFVVYAISAVAMLVFMKILCHFTLVGNMQGQDESKTGPPIETEEGPVLPSTNTSSESSQPPIAALLKPLVLYPQYLLIITGLRVEWPIVLTGPFRALAALFAPASPETLSIDCLLTETSTGVPVALQKILFYLAMPVAMCCVLLLLEWFISFALVKWKRSTSEVQLTNRLLACFMVVLFFFLPSLARTTFSMFACIRIDAPAYPPYAASAVGDFWLYGLNIQCFVGSHRPWAIYLGVPLLLLLCFVLPGAIAYVMLRNKHRLEDASFKQHFGFLYTSYRPAYCYWECVAVIQTLVIVAVGVFGFSLGSFYQSVVMSATIAAIGLLLGLVRPFAHPAAGRMMMYCVGVLLITSYAAMTFVPAGTAQSAAAVGSGYEFRMVVGAVVLVAHVAFIVYVAWLLIKLLNWAEIWASALRLWNDALKLSWTWGWNERISKSDSDKDVHTGASDSSCIVESEGCHVVHTMGSSLPYSTLIKGGGDIHNSRDDAVVRTMTKPTRP